VKHRLLDVGAALLSAALWAASFHPANLPWLAWIALVPWLLRARLRPADAPRADVLAWVVAQFGLHVYALWWTTTCAPPLAFLVPLLGLPFSWLTARLLRRARGRGVSDVVAVPGAIILVELLRDHALQGLTWISLGYALDVWPAALALAAVGRVHLVSVVVIVANVLVADLAVPRGRGRRRPALALAGLLVGVAVVGGALRAGIDMTPGPRAAGLQGNIPQYAKRGSAQEQFRRHLDLLDSVDREALDLLVYAETSFPGVRDPDFPLSALLRRAVDYDPRRRRAALFSDGVLSRPDQTTVLGVAHYRPAGPGGPPDVDGDGLNEWNTAWVVRGGEPTSVVYRKRGLAPFGEYLPIGPGAPLFEVVRDQARAALGHVPDLTPGEGPTLFPATSAGGERRGALNICFEIVFPRYFREAALLGADFVVNLSNDAWFKDSAELDLVDQATRWRAVECGRAVFRVSNAGISTLFSPDGTRKAVVETPSGRRKEVPGVLLGTIPIGSGATFYVRFGDWPWVAVGVFWAIFSLFRRRPPGTAGTKTEGDSNPSLKFG
jgi:apolipoprotein N-acyltransferase